MSLKDEFLKIETYEKFDRRREEFRELKYDKEIGEHLDKIFPEAFAPKDKHVDVAILYTDMHQEEGKDMH